MSRKKETWGPLFDTAHEPIRKRANQWMDNHPEAMALFMDMALRVFKTGRPYSIKSIVERVRWHYHIDEDDQEQFKVNNSYSSYIARRLIELDPRLSQTFRLRALISEAEE